MSWTTAQIWEVFHERLHLFILKRVDDPDDAEDILQEVFIKIHSGLARLQDEERLAAWVYQISRNAVIDYYRSRPPAAPLPDDLAVAPAPIEADPEAELAGGLRLMVDNLPEKYRQALILTELEGMKQTELAQRLGLSTSGAKSRVQRGREMLRAELLACCRFEFDRRGKIIDYTPRLACCQN